MPKETREKREKDLEVGLLLDFYGELLSPEKREAVRLYFDEDLSLGEIAKDADITRQGVRDRIEKAKTQLYTYEEKLGLATRFYEIDSVLSDIVIKLEGLKAKVSDESSKELSDIINEVKNITI